jgi:hypothetical protein
MMRLAIPFCLMLCGRTTLPAQGFPDSARYAGSLSIGSFRYKLRGEGESGMIALRVESQLSRFVVAEGGILYAWPHNQAGDATHFWAPEIQVQVQRPFRGVAPYVGIGGGVAYDSGHYGSGSPAMQSAPHTDPTFSAAVGVRAWFTDDFGARTELRMRGVGGDFVRSTAEWTIGVALRP